jgi:hypothetical protein
LIALYKQSELFGGQLDENRDSEERLRRRAENDPQAILLAEREGELVATVSLISDDRVAWLFRFAAKFDEPEVTAALCATACAALRAKGHKQVLVYTPVGDDHLGSRYRDLGFIKGNDYTCYWKDISA